MSAIKSFREWLAEFPGDIETLEDIRDAIGKHDVVGAISQEILDRRLREANRDKPF